MHLGGESQNGEPVILKLAPPKVVKLVIEKKYKFLKGLNRIENNAFENYLDYCKSDYFKRLKLEVLKRAKHKCSNCKGQAHTAHHVRYRAKWTDSKPTDCIPICNTCHNKIHENDIQHKKLLKMA